MAKSLTVSEIRAALLQAGGGQTTGGGEPSSAALGRMFHAVLAGLLGAESPVRIGELLHDHDPGLDEWRATLKTGAYEQLLGPLLTQQAATLDGQGASVCRLWTAVQAACDWLAEVWQRLKAAGLDDAAAQACLAAEQPVVREFHRAGWSEPVAVIGQIDALVRIPQSHQVCLLEWKIGQTSPAVDLGQACLYHLLLSGEHAANGSALALVSFLPQRHEQLFNGAKLAQEQSRLTDLVGRLAGVDGPTKKPAPTPEPPTPPQPKGRSGRKAPQPPVPPVPVPSQDWLQKTSDTLLKVLRQHNAPCRAVHAPVIGLTFVRFFLFPEKGVTTKKVLAQAENLHLHLGLDAAPGMQLTEGRIGVDIPRPQREAIAFSRLLPHLRPAEINRSLSSVPVGVDLQGRWKWIDLADSVSAHALIVGTPGSGKSQWLRTAVASLMVNNTPETLELLLIDPKQNAFGFAQGSPFLTRPVVVPGHDDVAEILAETVDRMVQRNCELAQTNSQSLAAHAQTTGQPQRRLVIVCDEYADLLAACGSKKERDELEKQFRRLAQVGRAPGFHLLLATQQPRGQILSTSIRSLIPVRVALRVTTPLESKVALDGPGADRLLGDGDLYCKCIGDPQRLQGAWLPAEEERLVSDSVRPGIGVRA